MKGQSIQRSCLSDELYQQSFLLDPLFKQKRSFIDQHQKSFIRNQGLRGNEINIPVVVHVIYHSNDENINDSLIQSQIDVLNNDFGQIQTNKYLQASASKLKFTLATSDPQGYKTNGITRTYTSIQKFQTGSAIMSTPYGGKTAWPSSEYLNIWVGNLSGVLGFAYMPGTLSDGVVIGYQFFGKNKTMPFNLGRTTTHEVGHWLNLYHTWGLMTGCESDDEVEDTPNSAGPNYGCQESHASCQDTDMVENYMDYSDDACMNLFTHDQVLRMEALFSAGGFRESILHSHGLDQGIINPCNNGIQDGDETGIDCGGICNPCSCMSKGTFSLFDYIEFVKINDSIAITGDNEGSFTNYAKQFELFLNRSNILQLSTGKSANQSKEYWSVWIDWNKDGSYNADELIYKKNSIGLLKDTIDLNKLFINKAPPALDVYHLRIQMKWGEYGNGCDTFDFGEVENYSVTLKRTITDPCNNGIQDGNETSIDCGPDCKPCTIQYCDSKGKVSRYEFIKSVTIGTWNNVSGNNNGYGDFTSTTILVDGNQELNYSLVAGFGGNYTLSENWYFWADWNQDGDFEDENEMILNASSTIPLSGNFKIPNHVDGKIRLRIQMRDSKKANACEVFGYGEVEDYSLNVKQGSMRLPQSSTSHLSIKIYPNPVHTGLQLHFDHPCSENNQIKLINSLGQTIFSKSIINITEYRIDCTSYLSGIYSLEISNNKEKVIRQVLIAH